MKLLLYRYGNICEPDLLSIFRQSGMQVIEEGTEITNKKLTSGERIGLISKLALQEQVHLIFSINFFPSISDLCQTLRIPYLCWSVDCPVLELFSSSVQNSCNRIFLFDYHQYECVSPLNPSCVYYLPLATNVSRWDDVIASISPEEIVKYSSEVSLVGSLYTEKSPFFKTELSPSMKGYVDGIIEAQLKVTGYNFLEELSTPALIAEIHKHFPDFPTISNPVYPLDAYTVANYYLGLHASAIERIQLLNALAEQIPLAGPVKLALYTRSSSPLLSPMVQIRGGVATLTEMPKVFHLSKINLNITMRPIQTGLSLRIWDILGCGGFLMTNYQGELPEYFEIDKDLVCFENAKELIEKVKFYLAHEDIRKEIAWNGYQKVKSQHTYAHRISAMFKLLEKEWTIS